MIIVLTIFVFFFLRIFIVGELCHLFTAYVVKNGISPIQGVRILAQAVDKIRLFDSQLTAVHADLCQLSLCVKVFNPALKFLEIDITSIFSTEVSIFSFCIVGVFYSNSSKMLCHLLHLLCSSRYRCFFFCEWIYWHMETLLFLWMDALLSLSPISRWSKIYRYRYLKWNILYTSDCWCASPY